MFVGFGLDFFFFLGGGEKHEYCVLFSSFSCEEYVGFCVSLWLKGKTVIGYSYQCLHDYSSLPARLSALMPEIILIAPWHVSEPLSMGSCPVLNVLSETGEKRGSKEVNRSFV